MNAADTRRVWITLPQEVKNASDSGKDSALPANYGSLESIGILASNVQRSPAASFFALRYDGPTF